LDTLTAVFRRQHNYPNHRQNCVTTEVCVHTTVREANDRGYRALVVSDCCGSYFPEFHEVGLRMVAAQGGIFGWVTDSQKVLDALG
jgi:nicotinamidase-related amidase